MPDDGLIIVGGGAAAYSACQHLRANGFEERIRIIGDEPSAPYERPPLSKAYLAGDVDADALLFRPDAWYSDMSVELLTNTKVDAVGPSQKSVTLDDGKSLAYDHLLIASGGTPRRLPEFDGDRVAYLRTTEDADNISRHLASGARIAVLGGGFIGAEVAATARRKGAEVTIIEALDVPMKHALGEQIGQVYTEIHRDEGVAFELGSTLKAVAQSPDGLSLVTSRDTRIECDLLVIGIGLVPNVDFLVGSGITLDNGVVVDEFAETNIAGIYAAGDIANHWHPLFERRIRVEHHDNALQQAVAAMNKLLGHAESYRTVHWVWSDQYDYNLQFAGSNTDCDGIVVRGSIPEREFSVFYLKDRQLRAVLGVGRGRDVIAARRLIGKSAYCDAAKLADVGVKLKDAVIRDQV